ncbi:GntR family transcriptional regulator [Yinghuangia soli]|uniref:GntR family transcriptional regulator n=1 Tax=Yinghuangia soli TaxID=2908204 RepID=A0AA41U542_9ACTN|nr:GntR family transcriptional regulator [Yinghuangia soli]MCF2531497.1 GntR family transcriptional regulator [Yinghuangia soli]
MDRAADRVYEALRAGILDGSRRGGSRLTETGLAEELNASRTPVREALRRLAAEGLVDTAPHKGARVTDWTPHDLEELYDLRSELEAHAAERAATRVGEEDLVRLAGLADQLEQQARRAQPDLEAVARINADFHDCIQAAASSRRLAAVLRSVVRVPLVLSTYHRYSPEDLRRSCAHHRELVQAFRAKDGRWARAVMTAHIAAAKDVLMRTREHPAGQPAEHPPTHFVPDSIPEPR